MASEKTTRYGQRAELGKKSRLRVVKTVPFGVYLDAGKLGEVLLPTRYLPKGCKVNDEVEVFVYLDSEDIPIATTLKPRAMVGECAHLKVVAVNRIGAFLDWGLPKDLLVPFAEQRVPMEVGRSYTVYLYVDSASQRIAASSKLSKYLSEEADGFSPGQAVDLLICGRTDLGLKAVIDGSHLGMIFKGDILEGVKIGKRVKGYIKAIREDGKIDLSLQALGQAGRDELSERILAHLKTQGGSSSLTDKSAPEAIYKQYRVSKANYKKALGRLFKARRISIDKQQVSLVAEADNEDPV